MTDEREDPAVFGLISTPKARVGMMSKLFQSVFEAEVIVWSIVSVRASETGIRMGMR